MIGTELLHQSFPWHVEQRGTPRTSISLPVLIYAGRSTHSARLRDLAAGGALLEITVPLEIGERVELVCGTIRVDATIKWRGEDLLGIEFDVPLPERQLAEQVSRSKALEIRFNERALALS